MKGSRLKTATIRERAPFAVGLLRNYVPWIVLVIVVVVFSLLAPGFLSVTNLMSVLNAASIGGLMAIGLTFVLLAGGFDLSIAAIMLVGGMIFGTLFINLHLPVGAAVLLSLAAATGLGLVNGLLVTRVKLPPFIATFATMFVYTGLSLAIGGGMAIYFVRGPYFTFLGQGKLGIMPMPAVIFIAVAIVAYLVLRTTTFGRAVYAVGGNDKAAHMAGINVDRIRLITYLISGFLCGLAALIYSARLEVANVVTATLAGYSTTLLDAISAVMIGGISIFGGVGKMHGLIGGILLVFVLSNGMGILAMTSAYHMLAKGLLIALAVGLDIYFRSGVSLRRRLKWDTLKQ
jgi:ribose/xylose/arabinose/galactoside ABC-type transport system permease subunit